MHKPDHKQLATASRTLRLHLPDAAATHALGRDLAPLLTPGMVVWLDGDLGAGKTTLTRALVQALGHQGSVKSPSYSLVEVYVLSNIYLYHFDFYRFESPEEFADAGLDEYFRDDAICLAEWPDKAVGYVPTADLVLAFRMADFSESGRKLELIANSAEGERCLNALRLRHQQHHSPSAAAN